MANDFKTHPEWEGSYEQSAVGTVAFDVMPDLKYHNVIIEMNNENCVLIVPTFWLDARGRFVLYPHPEFNLHGMFPNEWTEAMFNRRRYPSTKFVEFPVQDFLSQEASKL